ncbi:hypothetical protein [Bacteroides sp. 224]|uniref:hypothetical protein n=1 Tax=Bacteroides sp. 224 TaxID=2302936 RepID=UPI0013D70753|nr:hypothetical protein [Bacteroides sp. 224]NDV65523.1 hypothetical protein [Bacteroides sp. 224]
MKKSILYAIIFVYSILLYACNKKTSDLENALIMAGENRNELEKVLSHYSQHPEDTLKYKAACFLIENMPEHYSYKDSFYINRYYQQLDSVADIYKDQHIDIKDRLFRQITKEYNQKMEVIPDIQIMQANYLIENIDRSFDVWLNGEWSQHLDFDEFCEYILPYKSCEAQIFDNWRDYFRDYCNENIKKHKYSLLLKNAAFNACEAVKEERIFTYENGEQVWW